MKQFKIKSISENKVIFTDGSTYTMNSIVQKFSNNFKENDIVEIKLDLNKNFIIFMKKITSNSNNSVDNTKSSVLTKKELGYVYLNGKWYATFEVLLNKAHELYNNNFSIKSEMLEHNSQDKLAIFKTTIKIITKDGNICYYQATGDAMPSNLGPMVKNAYIRMAETRSIVRALRLATNIAEASIEEIHIEDNKNLKSSNKKDEGLEVEEIDLSGK